jgi:starvation-inducible outer membrane lipoprotein
MIKQILITALLLLTGCSQTPFSIGNGRYVTAIKIVPKDMSKPPVILNEKEREMK